MASVSPRMRGRAPGVEQEVERDQARRAKMSIVLPPPPDRLRSLLDLVVGSLDEANGDGRALARRAHFSRDHLDRLLARATGESPVALRRRLLLERAAWQLRAGAATPTQAAAGAGYGSLAAFSRAFARGYGMSPSAFAADDATPVALDAPNGVHFHPPAGVLVPGRDGAGTGRAGDLTERLVAHHLDRTRELLAIAAALPAQELARPLRPGFVAVWFEGEEPSAALMAERLVATLEIWCAAIAGEPHDGPQAGTLLERLDRAGSRFARLARAIRDRGAWDEGFIDALCEPPESFTYGGVLAHVIEFGAIRREALAGALAELGAGPPPGSGDPITWEAGRGQPV
jgi:AraC family transcriptional regulator